MYIYPVAVVFGTVPVAITVTINTTVRPKGRKKEGQWPSLLFLPGGQKAFAASLIAT
jgi:hypothetical protein